MLPPQKYIQQFFLPCHTCLAKPHPWLSLIFHRLCATTFVAMAGKTNADLVIGFMGVLMVAQQSYYIALIHLLFYSLR